MDYRPQTAEPQRRGEQLVAEQDDRHWMLRLAGRPAIADDHQKYRYTQHG